MAKHNGKPSAINKSEEKTGIPAKINPDELSNNEKLTDKYTKDDAEIAPHVRTNKQNRNVDKPKPTNAHGYKN